jgi:two-component sensor histidine kinase
MHKQLDHGPTRRAGASAARERDELHHRLANTLNLAATFVRLERNGIEDPAARDVLHRTSARLGAMARVNRFIYEHGTTDRVDLRTFLSEALPDMGDGVGLRCELAPGDTASAVVPGKTAAELAVVVNELILNAAKHGDGTGDNHVVVSLDGGADGALELCVRDHGPGLPEGFAFDGAEGLGLRIVSALVKQVGGTIRARSDGGAVFTITLSAT